MVKHRCRRCGEVIELSLCNWSCTFDTIPFYDRPKNMVYREEYKIVYTLTSKTLLSEVKE